MAEKVEQIPLFTCFMCSCFARKTGLGNHGIAILKEGSMVLDIELITPLNGNERCTMITAEIYT